MINQKTQVSDKFAKKKRKYTEHKRESLTLAEAYETIDPAKAERIRGCSSELFRARYADGSEHLHTNRCFVRLCQVCNYARSQKAGGQTFQIVDAMRNDNPNIQFIMATFTVRNCLPEELAGTLDDMSNAFYRMMKYKRFKPLLGSMRAMEITHNLEHDTFHPHIHAVVAVEKRYFTGKDYLDFPAWQAAWKKAAKLNYDPDVDVRKIKGSLAKAVAEVTKYTLKSGDFLIPDQWEFTVRTVRLLNSVLHKRRFISFSGIFKDYHKKLNLSDPNDPDEDKPIEQPISVECYRWFDSYRQYRRVDFQ